MSELDLTGLLQAAQHGDAAAEAKLLPLVYDVLRKRASNMMYREGVGHTLQPTALVHEAYMRMIRQERVDWQGRTHFYALSSQMMRRVLVDHARSRMRQKRGGDSVKVSLDESLQLSVERDPDILALDAALTKLSALDPRQARIVEMRFFGGLTVGEVATILEMSKRAVEAEWTMIKAWLRRELAD